MLARVKESYRWSTITAFSGREYTKRDWRPVPDIALEEAKRRAADKDDALEFSSDSPPSLSAAAVSAAVESKATAETAAPGNKAAGKRGKGK